MRRHSTLFPADLPMPVTEGLWHRLTNQELEDYESGRWLFPDACTVLAAYRRLAS